MQYRDVRYAIPFLTQMLDVSLAGCLLRSGTGQDSRRNGGLYARRLTDCRSDWWSVIEGFKWAMLGGQKPPVLMMCVSMVAMLLLLVGGLYYFRRMEKTFADFV